MTSFPLLLIHVHFLLFLLVSISVCPLASHGCHEEERRALLNFKSSLEDPSHRLSSWRKGVQRQNCCDWRGIGCSSESFRVISIDLRNIDLESFHYCFDPRIYPQTPPDTSLRGKLSPYLYNITHLEYLDLSFNDFQGSEITHQFSYLTKLTHLDLSLSNFSGSIWAQFGNLAFLQYLDLSCYLSTGVHIHSTYCLESPSTKWVRGLVNLQVLRLSGIDLYKATSSKDTFSEHISYLWNLKDLDISSCYISGPLFPIQHFQNLSRLSSLKMKGNNNLNSSIPLQLANLTSLSILELSYCGLQGSIPYLPQLKELDVSHNYDLHTDLTSMFEHSLPKLQKLEISTTKANGSIPNSISNAPLLVSLSAAGCSIQRLASSVSNLKYLHFLDLSSNNFQESIPKSICDMFSLRFLKLQNSNITGTIPSCIPKLRNLSFFDVSENSIGGKVSLISLINELDLTYLDMSSNKLNVVIDQHLQPSKFKLESLKLESCNMEGFIPSYICNFTHLLEVDLSYNNLTGAIPSCIYKLKKLDHLDLSNNSLRGPLPLLPPGVNYLHLSNNKLNGEISMENGERLSSCSGYQLNDNELSGSIPSSICSRKSGMLSTSTTHIDLSNNKLSGIIPSSIGYCRSLNYLNLGNNNLTGNLPNQLQHTNLYYLDLRDNNLNGTLSMLIGKPQSLRVLILGNNNFEGLIPSGIGSLSGLNILLLKLNRFNGSIPKEILHLQYLQILDLSSNNFSGQIPIKLGNFTSLTSRHLATSILGYKVQYQLATKGTRTQFVQRFVYNSAIDLSCNILSGSIPEEIGLLQGLGVLNLSRNLFSSNIPASVGNMSSLESLDLSSNILSGHIPKSLTSIDSLRILSLSNNNLSGRIPRASHFDTLSVDGSAFAGNELLCGSPLKKDCDGDRKISTGIIDPSSKVDEDYQEDANEMFLLYAIVSVGFAVGFWGLFIVLLVRKQKWWFPYWKIANSVAIKIVERCIHKN